jgi:hypothetical protein
MIMVFFVRRLIWILKVGPVNILGDACVFIVESTDGKQISTSHQSGIDTIIHGVRTLYLFEIKLVNKYTIIYNIDTVRRIIMSSNTDIAYEVLSPWADADPVPFRTINARINDLAGKKIGLFCNTKRVAEPTLKVIEDRLKNEYTSVTFSWFYNTAPNEAIIEQPRKDEFENWLKGVDEVIAAYGD